MPDILYCATLDRQGGARETSIESIDSIQGTDNDILWLHLDVNDENSRRWLAESKSIDPSVVDALLAEETRPRSFATERGLLVVLRGVNTNPGEDAEDMVSIRLWIEEHRIISTRRRPLLSVSDIRTALNDGNGPRSSGEFLAALIERIADRIGDFVDSIEDRLTDIEDAIADNGQRVSRQTLGTLRRQIAAVRRFLAPQRDALDRLYRQPGSWMSTAEVLVLREESDRITRYLEDLDLARERAVVLQEEFLGHLAQEQNTRMYVLSVVAAVFLPLTFVTGLLGMNVGGLPGVESDHGFWISLVVMLFAGIGLIAFFRWKRWI